MTRPLPDEEKRFFAAVSQLDHIEQVILAKGLRVQVETDMPNLLWLKRVQVLIDKHRAGQEVTPADLDSIEADTT